jgi:hypothetical protein
MSAKSGLDVYLKDHFAGAAGGSELAAKLSADHGEGPLGTFLAELSREIDHDKDTLENLMASLGVQPDPVKQAGAWVAEKASRLKLSDTLTANPDLKRLLQFELLSLGIEGKGELWRALITVEEAGLQVDADLEELIRRADQQRARLEEHRLEAARAALLPYEPA